LKDYTTDQTASVGFTGTVTVKRDYVSRDITQDPAIIEQMLRPDNTASSCALTVESTELRKHAETVPYEVTCVNDASIYAGSSVVKTKGVPGEMIVTEKTTYRNGAFLSTEIVGKELITAPVAEVVAVGTAPRPKTASSGTYIWPTEGIITSAFGPRTGFGSNNHQGIDIAGAYGESIVASDGGEVILAGQYYGYGLMVQILHDNGDVTYYGHCSDLLVEEGERVCQGQVIARMGKTGVANGVHCHFEIRRNGEPVDPLSLLP
jgi:murein DD-endopeptidase MepM/ murein hydrolase activator NlpD